MSKIKDKCINYLGDRGIYEWDRKVKRCADYKNLWFIIFTDYPKDVEISFKGMIYECYDEIPSSNMKWNKSNFEEIHKKVSKEINSE